MLKLTNMRTAKIWLVISESLQVTGSISPLYYSYR